MPASGIWPTKCRRMILPRLRTRDPGLNEGVGAITCHIGLNFAEFSSFHPRRGRARCRRHRHGLAPAARRVLGKAADERTRARLAREGKVVAAACVPAPYDPYANEEKNPTS